MNKTKMEYYYKPDSKTLRLDELDYTIIPNSDIKPLLDKLQQENKQLNGAIQTYDILLKTNVEENKRLKDNWNKLKEYNNKCINKLNTWLDKTTTEKARLRTYDEIKNKIQELEQRSDS